MIDLLPSAEQQALIDVTASFLHDEAPIERFRRRDSAGGGADRSAWRKFAALGWFGLGLPEESGGAGYSVIEETLLFRELGRFLLSPALAAAVVAARIAESRVNAAVRGRILSGELRVGLGVRSGAGDCDSDWAGSYSLIDGPDADLVLLWCGRRLAVIERERCTGIGPMQPFDATIRLDQVRYEGAPLLTCPAERTESLYLHATLLLTALAIGAAEAARDMGVAYVRTRQAFGKPIGAFQAIKHQCADMAVQAEAAWCQTALAAVSLAANRPEAQLQVHAARMIATECAIAIADRNIHLHGAMGFTEECDAHLYLKRAHLVDKLLQDHAAARRRLICAAMPGSVASREARGPHD